MSSVHRSPSRLQRNDALGANTKQSLVILYAPGMLHLVLVHPVKIEHIGPNITLISHSSNRAKEQKKISYRIIEYGNTGTVLLIV